MFMYADIADNPPTVCMSRVGVGVFSSFAFMVSYILSLSPHLCKNKGSSRLKSYKEQKDSALSCTPGQIWLNACQRFK